MSEEESQPPRGPRGGVPHQPGRGHDRKSAASRKKRFARKAIARRKAVEDNARQEWAEWDALPEEVKRLLGPTKRPRMPRPRDEVQDPSQPPGGDEPGR